MTLVCVLAVCVPAAAAPAATSVDPPDASTLTLAFGGDVQFARYRGTELVRHGSDDPFTAIAELLREPDGTFVNLENPVSAGDPDDLVRDGDPRSNHIRLRAPPSVAAGLARAGIDYAAAANNHSADCGAEGIAQTLAHLEQAGVRSSGLSLEGDPMMPVAVRAGGVTVWVFSVTTFTNRPVSPSGAVATIGRTGLRTRLARAIRALRRAQPRDLIVVSIHWGIEFEAAPRGYHRRIARMLIDHGAHVIMGHHSHVFQPVEVYRRGVVFYSLGNLHFDMARNPSRTSAVAHVRFRHTPHHTHRAWKVEQVKLHAIHRDLSEDGPRPAPAGEAKRFFTRLLESSGPRDARFQVRGKSAVWSRAPRAARQATASASP